MRIFAKFVRALSTFFAHHHQMNQMIELHVTCLCKTSEGIEKGAEKMMKDSLKKLPLLAIDTFVPVPVPKIGRCPMDTKNIPRKIL